MQSIPKNKSLNESLFVYNDEDHELKVIDSIESELRKCQRFDFSIAFITQEGVQSILQTLDNTRKTIRGRILTSDYLNFNEPKALRKLLEFENIEVRMFCADSEKIGFHTKGYTFYSEDETSIIIGSSNLTANALSKNKEWNVKITSKNESEFIDSVKKEFESMWSASESLTNEWIDTYELRFIQSKNTIKREIISRTELEIKVPNKMQEEALLNLERLRKQGVKKAILISATGTGKTYLSAFDVKQSGAKKLLFLVHREQILDAAMKTYADVFGPSIKIGKISGNEKDLDADFIFSTTQSMSKKNVLNHFNKDHFDYIVFDEAHHIVADTNSKIISFFEPKQFELGMTATPERPDGADIFEKFDNNIAYEIRLQNALKQDMLCPFHYYGISDITVNGNLLGDDEDIYSLTSDERVKHIMEKAKFYGYSGTRVKGLIFCRDISDGQKLSEKLNEKGLRTVFLQGMDSIAERENAVKRLEQDSEDNALDYILTVNIFNEGVDIKKVNQIIMLRPTQSSIVFIQQLGRGLRKADNIEEKEYLVVIDFIGEYKNNFLIPVALSGERILSKEALRKFLRVGTIPGCSTISFDTISESKIYDSINSTRDLFKLIKEKYRTLVKMLGYEPNLTQLFDMMDTSTYAIDPLEIVKKQGTLNEFKKNLGLQHYNFSENENLMLKFVSKQLMKGFRPQELMILKGILKEGTIDIEIISSNIAEEYGIHHGEISLDSAISVLTGNYSKKDNTGGPLIIKDGKKLTPSDEMTTYLKTDGFKESLEDCVSCGLKIFRKTYSNNRDSPFTLYERYGRFDVIRLLNFKEKIPAQNIGGYFANKDLHVCPIFVTYKKSSTISKSVQYEDKFIDYETFDWYTKNKRNLQSPDVKEILNPECTSYLFIQKGDDDTSDFYYIGKVKPIPETAKESTILDDEGKELSIVNIKLMIEQPVPDKLFTYITS